MNFIKFGDYLFKASDFTMACCEISGPDNKSVLRLGVKNTNNTVSFYNMYFPTKEEADTALNDLYEKMESSLRVGNQFLDFEDSIFNISNIALVVKNEKAIEIFTYKNGSYSITGESLDETYDSLVKALTLSERTNNGV